MRAQASSDQIPWGFVCDALLGGGASAGEVELFAEAVGPAAAVCLAAEVERHELE